MNYSKRNCKSKKRAGSKSAADYMLKTVGDGNRQYNDVFSVNSPFPAKGNTIVSLKGQYLGGKGKSKKHTRKVKGGNLAQIINKAIIPFGLLGLQQSYRRKKGGSKKCKSRRKH